MEGRAEHPIGIRSQCVGDDRAVAVGLEQATLEVASGIGTKLARAMMRQVLEDASVHLLEVSDVELPSHRIAMELANPCKS